MLAVMVVMAVIGIVTAPAAVAAMTAANATLLTKVVSAGTLLGVGADSISAGSSAGAMATGSATLGKVGDYSGYGSMVVLAATGRGFAAASTMVGK